MHRFHRSIVVCERASPHSPFFKSSMQRQVITRIAAPLARQAVGVQRRGFVGGLVNKSNKVCNPRVVLFQSLPWFCSLTFAQVVETQKFMQRQGVAVGADAPTFLR